MSYIWHIINEYLLNSPILICLEPHENCLTYRRQSNLVKKDAEINDLQTFFHLIKSYFKGQLIPSSHLYSFL